MRIIDKLIRLQSQLSYSIGTILAKIVLKEVGKNTSIHISVKYVHPSKIAVGDNCEIRQGTYLDARADKNITIRIGNGSRIKDLVGFAVYGGDIYIGKKVLVGRCCTIMGHGGVQVGDNTMIGPSTVIVSSNHLACLTDKPFQNQGFTRERIEIGDNVWIGANATILPGSTIEPNVVIGAGSVVKGTLKSGWLYGGIPAEPIIPLEIKEKNETKVCFRNWSLLD